jgi:hypothetical protein
LGRAACGWACWREGSSGARRCGSLASRRRLDGGAGLAVRNDTEKVENIEGRASSKYAAAGQRRRRRPSMALQEGASDRLGFLQIDLADSGFALRSWYGVDRFVSGSFFGRFGLSVYHTSLKRSGTSDLESGRYRLFEWDALALFILV